MPPSGGSQRRQRLTRSGDFDRVFRDGSSSGNRFLVLYAFPRSDGTGDGVRLGVSVGRKVGGAVERNAVKRALREAFWASDGLAEGHDYVLVARPDTGGLVEREGVSGVTSALTELIGEDGLPAGGRST